MIPLHDRNPSHTTPVLTMAIIAANVLVFLWQIALGGDAATFRFGMIPAEIVHGADTIYAGRRWQLPPGVEVQNFNPAWATVFTSMFMHANWLHILSNMWFLWLFGNNIEDTLGRGRYLLFYVVGGVAAAGAQIAIGSDSPIPMIGASGAVSAVLGAYMVTFPHSRIVCLTLVFIITAIELPAGLVLGLYFLMQIISGIGALGMAQQGGVAYAAHVGGFIAGMILIKLMASRRRPPPPPPPRYTPRPDFMDWR